MSTVERASVLHDAARWLETRASPALVNDPFILASTWAAGLIREYADEVLVQEPHVTY